ncbi:hypothetical protein BJX66DRAFT_199986 [Aspergillus keveii]|uniref:Uncharacterized protein n=1 Tax=Aspergillus keveii TaxID=714993 RepID=A0ABR4FGN1_9EURO
MLRKLPCDRFSQPPQLAPLMSKSRSSESESDSARPLPVPLVKQSALRDSACYYDPRKDKRRKEALKYAEQTTKALEAIIAILYNGTEVDLDDLKAKVKSFASPEAVMEELLNDGYFE